MTRRLNHSPADIASRVIIQLGYGNDPPTVPWPVGVDTELGEPDNVITVMNTEGRSDGSNMVTSERDEHYGISVRIRAATPQPAWDKANEIGVAFDEVVRNVGVTIDGQNYLVGVIRKTSGPIPIGKEIPATKRSICTLNAVLTVRKV
jgi:hypothetical protein